MGNSKLDFEKIDEARRVLELGESATLKEIKKAYKNLVKIYHPDRCKDEKREKYNEKMIKINNAYELLMDYCEHYRYSFRKRDIEDFFSRYMKGFEEDWMWSPMRKDNNKRKHDYGGI